MTKYRIELRYSKGWRKANRVGLFLLESAATEYATKYYLKGWWRIVAIKA
jgi:hypothetical protein